MSKFFAIKSVEQILKENAEGHQLKRALGLWALVAIGIGCIIGTGIFVLTGKVAIENAGPGVIISFVFCGIACIFAALCYAEFASFIPIAGSAYTYSYATMGELVAWIIGWDLILEYGLSTSAVAVGWSSYFVNFLEIIGIKFPQEWALTPFESVPGGGTGIFNFPAAMISGIITWLLIVGIRESARVNNIVVIIKLAVAMIFIGIGVFFIDTANWIPLIPSFQPIANSATEVNINTTEMWKMIAHWFGSTPQSGFGGWGGIVMGASVIFFAYIGFDAVSTTSEEAKNPSKDVPRAIILSLVICTLLYIVMAAVFTGIVRCDGTLKLDDLGTDKGAPLAYAFKQVNNSFVSTYAKTLIVIGGLAGITSVLLVTLLGQSRIFFAMSRDRLLPAWVSDIHPKYQTPYKGTFLTGLAVMLTAGFVPLGTIAEMANIGTLFAFVLVSLGILYLRKTQPERIAAFRTPLVPLIPILAALCCFALMLSLPVATWIRFFVWMTLGVIIYFTYSVKRSKLQNSMK
jgi:basic amino acid/polyamine antiporter, APA family